MSYPAPDKPVRGFERAESLFDVPNKIDLIHSQSARLADQEGLYDGPQHRGSERGQVMRGKIAAEKAKREEEIGRAMSAYQPYPTKNRAMDEAMSSYGPRFTPEMDTGKGSSDGRRTPINIPKYVAPTDKIVPEVVNVPKNVKPDYGKMPGFQFHDAGFKKPDGTAAGYWSADETSDFWQTDAGYDKALQTWGQKPGWVKPGYRPKKKELDIDAIKKWFKPNK